MRTSNVAHCLFAGIAREDRSKRAAETQQSPETLSGRGVRTVSAGESSFNPMSYQNGSVWPHDNSIIAAVQSRYGRTEHALTLNELNHLVLYLSVETESRNRIS